MAAVKLGQSHSSLQNLSRFTYFELSDAVFFFLTRFLCVFFVSKSSAKAVSTQVGGQLTNPSATVQGGEGGSEFGEQSGKVRKHTYGTK